MFRTAAPVGLTAILSAGGALAMNMPMGVPQTLQQWAHGAQLMTAGKPADAESADAGQRFAKAWKNADIILTASEY